jgi:acyl-CoA thioester hydrolase
MLPSYEKSQTNHREQPSFSLFSTPNSPRCRLPILCIAKGLHGSDRFDGVALMHPAGPHRTPPTALVGLSASHVFRFRVRYSETDQMGTFYNSRPLEWFECGRTELLRHLGLPYATLEARGLFLPVVEAHLELHGRARYDDHLEMTSRLAFQGRARVRVDNRIAHVEGGRPVAGGWTVHGFTDREGRVLRPPGWFLAALGEAAGKAGVEVIAGGET